MFVTVIAGPWIQYDIESRLISSAMYLSDDTASPHIAFINSGMKALSVSNFLRSSSLVVLAVEADRNPLGLLHSPEHACLHVAQEQGIPYVLTHPCTSRDALFAHEFNKRAKALCVVNFNQLDGLFDLLPIKAALAGYRNVNPRSSSPERGVVVSSRTPDAPEPQ